MMRSGRASLLNIWILGTLAVGTIVACIAFFYLHKRAEEQRLESYRFPEGITLDTPIIQVGNNKHHDRPTVRDRLKELGAAVNDQGKLVDFTGRPIAFFRKSYPGYGPMKPEQERALEEKYKKAIEKLSQTNTVIVLTYHHF